MIEANWYLVGRFETLTGNHSETLWNFSGIGFLHNEGLRNSPITTKVGGVGIVRLYDIALGLAYCRLCARRLDHIFGDEVGLYDTGNYVRRSGDAIVAGLAGEHA
jgi:hypothetical protein